MICQAITPQGGISADYTLAILVGMVGFLLIVIATIVGKYFINALGKIEEQIKEHSEDISFLKTHSELINQKFENFGTLSFDENKLADSIITKLRATGAAFKTN